MMMRESLSGSCRNAAETIERLCSELKRHMADEEWEELEGQLQPKADSGMLREIMKHASETSQGKHTVEEFAKFYCLKD